MLHIQAVLVHSKAVTAAEKSSGLPDNQASLQLPEISVVPLAPANYACLRPLHENILSLVNLLVTSLIKHAGTCPHLLSQQKSQGYFSTIQSTTVTRFAAL